MFKYNRTIPIVHVYVILNYNQCAIMSCIKIFFRIRTIIVFNWLTDVLVRLLLCLTHTVQWVLLMGQKYQVGNYSLTDFAHLILIPLGNWLTVFSWLLLGVRILDGPMTDSLEAMAFNSKMHINDIYSCRSVSIMEVKLTVK